ncbi:ABC transporter ATP-binding protein [Pseudomonas sp. PH1b]|uniref:ABC transporter ATP-binding protein n=1 Tax=Pseudomonas sp. PH1b TaxID=1397282 RepID=UPI0009E08F95|nr:ABC transporter ATP-binding protein [Pseudomonas sp. PH1b]
MSSELAIKVDNLSKCYQIYEKPRDRLLQMLAGGRRKFYREFWAVKEVSFEIRKGETVGIVGRNGSGKSTLLQMICGTLNPTGGSIQANGRIAALLELGSGFNPEFTGRENVYLNAAVLGLTKEYIESRLDDILGFAEIGEFIDQPVKTYSSGMLVRLAFSVAINVDPQILIVDEALSVGDELFQRKCFSRIEAIKEGGATILFVSHSGATVIDLCDRAILIDSGELLSIGSPKIIVGRYQKLLYASVETREIIRKQVRDSLLIDGPLAHAPEIKNLLLSEEGSALRESFDPSLRPTSTIEYASNGAIIESPVILSPSGERFNNLIRNNTYRYTYSVSFSRAVTNVRFGMLIKTMTGIEVGGAHTANQVSAGVSMVEQGQIFRVEFEFSCRLNPGVYFLNAGVTGCIDGVDTYLHRLLDVEMFRVLPDSANLATAIVDFGCIPKLSACNE